MPKINYQQKPKRPFGLSLAIIASILLFTILPLLEIVFILSVNDMMAFDTVGRSGMDVVGIESYQQQMILQGLFALGFLIIGILSWIGRPSKMRYLLSASILGISLLTIFQQILPRLNSIGTSLDASREVNQPIITFHLILTILITIYSVWYINRWASRAFYRGYYLQGDIDAMRQIEQEIASQSASVTSS